MRLLQRLSAAVALFTVGSVGLALVAESVGLLDAQWRLWLADHILSPLATPTGDRWQVAVLGMALGVIAVVVAISQFIPYRRASRYQYVVEKTGEGSTAVTARTVQSSIEHRLSNLPGVLDASSVLTPSGKAVVRVEIADDADLAGIDVAARNALAAPFWESLGLDLRPVDVMYQFRRTRRRIPA